MIESLIKSFVRLVVLIIVISLCSFAANAQKKQPKKTSNGEKLITALINSKTLPGLFRLDSGVFGEGSEGLSPDVIRILKLGKRAIPLLIRHLDDRRVFKNMVFCCTTQSSDGEKVTVGEGAFFMLVVIIRENAPMFDRKCLKADRTFNDGIGDCIAEKYYSGKNMKRNWLKAYRAGKIRYKKYEY